MATCTSTYTLLRSSGARPTLFLRLAAAWRFQSTLKSNTCNPHIYTFPDERTLSNHLLTLLPTSPPNPDLAIGTTTSLPPTPSTFTPNPQFLTILHSVLRSHAHEDHLVIGAAQSHASSAGSSLGSGGAFFPNQPPRRRKKGAEYGGGGGAGGDGAGGASAQGGAGGAGRGGHIHVYDVRHPPDFGRIPDTDDIFGSLEVDAEGEFVDGTGRYQESGTYRVVTPDGMLGLTDYLRGKVVERLREEEQKAK